VSRDPTSRGAARWATLVAVPVALLTGVASYAIFDRGPGEPGAPGASAAPPTARPRATSPVTVAAPPLSGRAEVVCRALLSRMPDALRGQARRPVTAGAEQNAAYGDPPVTVACGAPAAAFPATDRVFSLNGVCWHLDTGRTGSTLTTVDREVPVLVTVPGGQPGPGQWVIDLADPLVAAVPSLPVASTPGGCQP
jgi:hypothetical protein